MLSLDKQNSLREQYRAQNPGWRPATELYADLVRSYVKSGHGRVLDLGCGRGGLVEQLGHPLAQIVGLDPDWPSLAEHRLAPRLPRTAGLSAALPFRDNSFDLIFASWLLEHLETPAVDVAEIGRVLRPGGAFVFITPNGLHPLSWLNHQLGRFTAVQGRLVERLYGRAEADAFPTRYRANTRAQLTRLAEGAGLQVAQLQAIGDPTYLAFVPGVWPLLTAVEKRLPPERRVHLVGVLAKMRDEK